MCHITGGFFRRTGVTATAPPGVFLPGWRYFLVVWSRRCFAKPAHRICPTSFLVHSSSSGPSRSNGSVGSAFSFRMRLTILPTSAPW